jgi:hypothetical protein
VAFCDGVEVTVGMFEGAGVGEGDSVGTNSP